MLALTLAAMATAAASGAEPEIIADARVYPGRRLSVAVRGFEAASAVRLSLRGAGSCRPVPLARIVVDEAGGAWARVLMPAQRQSCDGRWHDWRPLARVTFRARSGDTVVATTAQINPRHHR